MAWQDDIPKNRCSSLDLPIGMVSQFPNDYVSGTYLGVVKRMIWLWMKGPLVNSCRIGAVAVQRISDALIA